MSWSATLDADISASCVSALANADATLPDARGLRPLDYAQIGKHAAMIAVFAPDAV